MMQRLSMLELELARVDREIGELRKELVTDFACLGASELAEVRSRLEHVLGLVRAENSRRQRGE